MKYTKPLLFKGTRHTSCAKGFRSLEFSDEVNRFVELLLNSAGDLEPFRKSLIGALLQKAPFDFFMTCGALPA